MPPAFTVTFNFDLLCLTLGTFDEMSTFDGYIKEFPDITGTSLCVFVSYKSAVDHFTHKPHRRPPRAAFLSHVHKDHMNGLERYDSSLIYCSHATKEVCIHET